MVLVEPMPKIEGSGEFPRWVVPARNNIQRQLLRLQDLIGQPANEDESDASPFSREIAVPLNRLAGVGFSLWRAVFQAGIQIGRSDNMKSSRQFLDQIIRDNAAVYKTEMNAWSCGYYLGNARLRILSLEDDLKDTKFSAELRNHIAAVKKLRANTSATERVARNEWETCFHCMRLMLDIVENRISKSGPERFVSRTRRPPKRA